MVERLRYFQPHFTDLGSKIFLTVEKRDIQYIF